ncbi:MAG: outer membrane lipoprotein chaperone LolA [Cellvibrionaceae bacterium]
MFFSKLFNSILVSFCLCSFVSADDAQELSALLKTYKTISGDFKQTLNDDKQELIQESSGHFMIKNPGLFNWETKEPFPQLLVSDLKKIWLYDPDLEQVTIRSYADSVDQTPALLLSGNTQKITENYKISKVLKTAEKDQNFNTFLLTPISTGSNFTELQLSFEKGLLVKMLLKDSLQQTTVFMFDSLALNKKIPASAFQFIPPEGVDVLIDE